MVVSLVAAMAAKGVIGNRGAMPWRLPDDMARFRRLTMGHAVVMGHATFKSMGKPLTGRRNIVLTRDPGLRIAGCRTVTSLDQALAAAGEAPATVDTPRGTVAEIFVIGGAAIYALFLPVADRMYLTFIDAAIPGDTLFPEVRWEEWRVARETSCPVDPAHPLPHRFVDYERKRQ